MFMGGVKEPTNIFMLDVFNTIRGPYRGGGTWVNIFILGICGNWKLNYKIVIILL